MKRLPSLTFVVGLSIALALAGVVCACNVPVFRFALERWRADPYRIVVFHREPLIDAERALLRRFEESPARPRANVTVRTVRVDDLDDGDSPEGAVDRDFLSHLRNPQYPFLAVQYPAGLQIAVPLWIGTLDQDAIAQVIDSPARRELVRRLAAGETAVWILLESGDAAKDAKAAELLAAELKDLEHTLKLPALTTSPDDALTTQLPLEVRFSLLRITRSANEEKALVAMLLGSEPDLAELPDAMVFPVFGRGRALLPLVGKGITAKNLHDAAEFLAGACSCEIKDQNPGFDLLLAADWEALLSPGGTPLAAASTSRMTATHEPTEAVLVPIPKGSSRSRAAAVGASTAAHTDTSAKSELPARYLGIAARGLAVAGAIGAAVAAAFVTRRRIA